MNQPDPRARMNRRPVPEDMTAALRGEAPVPEWFLEGRGMGGGAA